MTHRLDANTSGVVVFARKRAIAQQIQSQFESGSVKKTYLACVHGVPGEPQFECHAKISRAPGDGGLRRVDDADGHEASTEFRLIESSGDGKSLIECVPKTGRTNQIRIHLWQSGLPIVNDPSYLVNSELGNNQTLAIGEPQMCLHAWKLEIVHPESGEKMNLVADAPEWTNGRAADWHGR